ncbi:putative monooxygenase (salicylate/ hydroxybenzoate hydroxylase [Streptomyces poonensis]|uniref:Monooxygenase (salicylate/ hydroxybenzoate hydroxylase) n=1 Tax=Streptomyces poonensis TaxID=68255 RepID=A0A918QE19_9ACTN|nr:putative monooxygenase (salicylate/ hydroxybenzoate hydroxylase [Streptomyces poonensis]
MIVGGGIGGLAAALGIARAGHEVMVLERNDRFAELGAGIQLAPNGIAALDRLGLGAMVRERAVHIDHLRFMDGVTGEHVVSMPLTEDYRRRFGNPYVVVHRGELHRMLYAACLASPGVRLRAGAAVTAYDQDDTGTTVVLKTGERISGDAVIGADGIRSAIRRQLVGDGEPRVSGITVYRCLIPIDVVPDELRWNAVTWWAGPKCHFVHYAIAGGRYLNLAASSDDAATQPVAGVPVEKQLVQILFAGLDAAPRQLLALGEDWKAWVLVDRDPVDNWTDGRVTLLGDAAHPMLHYAAQGACQALEDAVLLGDLLDCSTAELVRRFDRYSHERRERTAAVQRVSRESIELWHPAGTEAKARNDMLSSMSATQLHDHVAWMHGARYFGGALLTGGASG